KCKEAYNPDDHELALIGLTREQLGGKNLYRGRGCETCNNTGYKGRVGIFELLRITGAVQALINQRQPTQIIKDKAIEEGMVTMRQDGISQILQGITTTTEVLQYTV
ncbi:MAG TPA: pilus assembly protein PilB, partial [Lentisphaeria bacterium]|nr:pilus assembly protein PilB [Lentisphaeria bacterium]